MKNLNRLLLLLLLAGTLFAKYHIVIVAGQSNCLNIHTRASALPVCESDTLVPFFYDLYYPPNFSPNHLVCTSDNTWERLQVHQGDEAISTSYSFFGPEMTLARTLLQHMDSVAIFKYGVAGSDLANEWSLDGEGGYGLFGEFAAKMDSAEKAMDDLEYDYEWTAMAWMQGESDGETLTKASNYYRNLGYFIKQTRDTLDLADLPVAIGLIGDEIPATNYPYSAKVRESQIRRANADPLATYVETADFEMDTDNVHFNSNGVKDLGVGFANAILSLITESAIDRGEFVLDNDLILLPNPVNGNAKAIFSLEEPARPNLIIYDLKGNKVIEMNYGRYSAGKHQLALPVYDLNSGLYIVKLTANDRIFINKLSVLK